MPFILVFGRRRAAGPGLVPAARIETAGRRDKPAKIAKTGAPEYAGDFVHSDAGSGPACVKYGDTMLLLPKVYKLVTKFSSGLGFCEVGQWLKAIAYFLGKSL